MLNLPTMQVMTTLTTPTTRPLRQALTKKMSRQTHRIVNCWQLLTDSNDRLKLCRNSSTLVKKFLMMRMT